MIGQVLPAVLVVDDDPAFLGLAVRVLEEMGVKMVLTAANAALALTAARASRPNAVLVDVGLPDRDGTDLARQLADLPWRPRVLVISADRDAGRSLGAQLEDDGLAFVPKEELASETVRRMLTDD